MRCGFSALKNGRVLMEVVCASCGEKFIRNPRSPNQSYCSKKECQRMRKSLWQKSRMKKDSTYRNNQRLSWKEWARQHPEYWKEYRKKHSDKTRRNSMMQTIRNRRRRRPELIAKMDALEMPRIKPSGTYYLVPMIAKMDALKVNIFEIAGSWP